MEEDAQWWSRRALVSIIAGNANNMEGSTAK